MNGKPLFNIGVVLRWTICGKYLKLPEGRNLFVCTSMKLTPSELCIFSVEGWKRVRHLFYKAKKVLLLDAHMGKKGIFLARQLNYFKSDDQTELAPNNDGILYIRNTFKKDTKKWFHTDVCEGKLSKHCLIIIINQQCFMNRIMEKVIQYNRSWVYCCGGGKFKKCCVGVILRYDW